MKKSYIPIIAEYFFSDKPLEQFSKSDQALLELAKDIITMHGCGGKFVESLVRYKLKIAEVQGIHGWDGMKQNTPVEIKTETICKSKLNCMASFSDNRTDITIGDIFAKERPLLINVGVCDETGKCIYLMQTDTSKLPKNNNLFEALRVKAPRISLKHWGYYTEAYKVSYTNKHLVAHHKSRITKTLYWVIS
jgi:hypothetical protein